MDQGFLRDGAGGGNGSGPEDHKRREAEYQI